MTLRFLKSNQLQRVSAAIATAALLAWGCSSDDSGNEGSADAGVEDPELGTIPEVAEAAGDFGTLLSALELAELDDNLAGEGPFTVFAPTDAAFDALPEGALDALLLDTEALANVLAYHVVASKLQSSDVVSESELTMLNGDKAAILVEGSTVRIDGATITVVDIPASNGVIHVIDAVMLPPEPLGNLAEVAAAAGTFSTLLTAVEAAGLSDALTGDDPLTVFAPTDEAFAALPEGTLEALLADTDELKDVLLHHILADEVPAADVVTETRLTTLLGPWLDVNVDGDEVTVNGVNVTVTDVQASNGIIHVIDAVLVPPPKLVDLVVATEDLSTLETAVIAADLVDTLNGPGPFTVFAPTNAAFDALPDGVLEDLLADPPALTDVLLYHVVSGRLDAQAVTSEAALTTLQGEEAVVESSNAGATIDGQSIVVTDIQARNGIVHVISGVMLP